jgi:hypothetical protein
MNDPSILVTSKSEIEELAKNYIVAIYFGENN